MQISRLNAASETAAQQLAALSSELHGTERKFSFEELEEMVSDAHIALVVAQDGEQILGMGTLYIIPKIGKRNAYIEDVIVDSGHRGQGLGEQIMRELISVARASKLNTLALKTNPKRTAAHKLYEKVGFKQIEEYVFQLIL